jgi:tRNA pseudouridine55 synthase
LERLTREYSRPFGLSQAHTLEEVLGHPEDFSSKVVSIADALPDCPHIALSREDAQIVRCGGKIRCPVGAGSSYPAAGQRVLMLDPDGKALALCAAEPGRETEAPVLRVTRGLWNT